MTLFAGLTDGEEFERKAITDSWYCGLNTDFLHSS
jgi:hypothetical protein